LDELIKKLPAGLLNWDDFNSFFFVKIQILVGLFSSNIKSV
jgi:hypothetical protein